MPRWAEPVIISLGVGAVIHFVDSNGQAADILLNLWPERRGGRHLAARIAVFAAMSSPGDAQVRDVARRAFAEAAREADILME